MAKKKYRVEEESYGIYTRWDRGSKRVPDLLKVTREIPARLDVEFGMVLHFRSARGRKLRFTIEHPSFLDAEGIEEPTFEGEQYVRSSDYHFFVGDTVWAPEEDKVGDWTMEVFIDEVSVARRTLKLVPDEGAS